MPAAFRGSVRVRCDPYLLRLRRRQLSGVGLNVLSFPRFLMPPVRACCSRNDPREVNRYPYLMEALFYLGKAFYVAPPRSRLCQSASWSKRSAFSIL